MSNRYEVRDATHQDAVVISKELRAIDAQEIRAITGGEPLPSVTESFDTSTVCRVGLADGAYVCIYGVCGQGVGRIWMLGTDLLEEHSQRFLRLNSDELERISQGYHRLENWCDARNAKTLSWLAWLGFTIEPPMMYGVEGLPFHYFWKDL
jgi:hypothetical protein